MFKVPENFRVKSGPLASDSSYGNNGLFIIKYNYDTTLKCIASDGEGWNHVSVTINRKECPTWEMMVKVKSLFWSDSDTVLQYHPARAEYIDCHPYCLHLWEPQNKAIPKPHTSMIAPDIFKKSI